MANKEHLKILKLGVEAWNKWRDDNDEILPDLRGADLSDADLSYANLSEANLSKANLNGAGIQGANLDKANLHKADLGGTSFVQVGLNYANLSEAFASMANFYMTRLYKANLKKADLLNANFKDAYLGEANLREAYLHEAELYRANLSEANLSEANLGYASISWADLRGANLYKAYLSGADLSDADLSEANLSEADLRGANLNNSNLTKANLTKADLMKATFVETNLEGADLSNCNIYGISAWNLRTDKDTKQLNLEITKPSEPIVTVDDIEVAQFIHLLVRHEKLRQVINSVAEKGVLILGRFGGGGIEILRAVAEKLRKMKYLPIIFDFDRPQDKNYTETIKTLAGLSRFVVVDLSGPSVPQELYATVPHFKIPFVPILEKGKQQYSMFADILEYDWVTKPIVEFDTTESLINLIPSKVVKPAEKRLKKRHKRLLDLLGE